MSDYLPPDSATVAEVSTLKPRKTVEAAVPVTTSAAAYGRAAQLLAAATDFLMLGETRKFSYAKALADSHMRLGAIFERQEQNYVKDPPEVPS